MIETGDLSGELIAHLFGTHSYIFKNTYQILDSLFGLYNLQNNEEFNEWKNKFIKIYSEKNCNKELFLTHTYLTLLIKIILIRVVLSKIEFELIDLENIFSLLNNFSNDFSDFERNFGNWIFLNVENNAKEINNMIKQLALNLHFIYNSILKIKILREDLFHNIYQELVSASLRHLLGEFYTPSFLARKMIIKSYDFGENVLDPACGSGTFIIELIKHIISKDTPLKNQILAISNIYGYDLNPFAVFISKINIFLLIKDLIPHCKINIELRDSLFPEENIENKFDLIIGNPPWLTYSSLESLEEQNKLKILVENLQIKPSPKNILNLDLSAVFFYQCRNLYLKNKGKIFFVITSGIITGSHNDRFRTFRGFRNIKIWTFTKEIFNVGFICLFAIKDKLNNNKGREELEQREIPVEYFDFKKSNSSFKIVKMKEDIYVPYTVVEKSRKFYVKKLISKEIKNKMYPYAKSHYFDLFHKGADLNPRNLIFIKFKKKSNTLALINVDKRILKKAKPPWNKIEYQNQIIEKKYIFKCAKSTELVKFNIFHTYNVFLPIEKYNLTWNPRSLSKYGSSFYKLMNEKYLKYKKNTTKHKSLMENLNRWGKLLNKRQFSDSKVVYNNSGSMLNAAVITGDYIITGDLSFLDTTNINEAYYLAAILNSPILSEQIKIRKSSRHIFKKALEFPIEKYNENNKIHKNLSEIGKIATLKSKEVCKKYTSNVNNSISKWEIQKQLHQILKPLFDKTDNLIHKMFYKSYAVKKNLDDF